MIISSTDLQNNFGKYLMLAAQEDIVITRNGLEIAKLTSIKESATGYTNVSDRYHEKAPEYSYLGKKASFDEFLHLQQSSDERYEYIDGEIYLVALPKTAHQIVITELFGFYNFFQETNCTPMVAPYDIELGRTTENINIVQPDIMIICDLDDYYKGVPSLVVEVLSKSTRKKDLIKKLDLYMSCGVSEYWIVNPDNKEVTVYLFEDLNICDSATYKNNAVVQSFVFSG
ncbi:type II toxin-antitoxin system Phd/YefM family antitoxin [Neobacillus sp. 3P2-tot-E-2]|uniref:type II toxin-antitoxin system prevent-host-death family antitoxin n=1 Tax=Neobacillus sp. 3P2-tot-E-2 TaxID=3132212 RepID=UPI0039A3189E